MAVVSRLANKAQSITYDFLTGALKEYVGSRTIITNGDGTVSDGRTLVAKDSDANIISAVATITECVNAIELYNDDIHVTDAYYLEESATGETTKRALIHSMSLTPIVVQNLGPRLGKAAAFYVLVITRDEIWEFTSDTTATVTDVEVSICGGMAALAAIDGSAPARIATTYLQSNGAVYSKLWMGIKPTLFGVTDFNPLWECELASLWAGATLETDASNSSPLGGANNVVTYAATTTETKILTLRLSDIYGGTNYKHFYGDYIVLLRARVSAAQSVRITMREGMYTDTREIPHTGVYISSTAYHFYNVGTIKLPPWGRHASGDLLLGAYSLRLYVERIGTAVDFKADCFVLIPASHTLFVSDVSVAATLDSVTVKIHEDGTIEGYMYDTSASINTINASVSPTDWTYPIEGGVIVLAAEATAGSTLPPAGHNTSVVVTYGERYRVHGE